MWPLECKHQMLTHDGRRTTHDDARRTTTDHNSTSCSGELIIDSSRTVHCGFGQRKCNVQQFIENPSFLCFLSIYIQVSAKKCNVRQFLGSPSLFLLSFRSSENSKHKQEVCFLLCFNCRSNCQLITLFRLIRDL